MSRRVPVSDLEPGTSVDQVFLVREREVRRNVSGGTYLACTLGDRSGDIQGRWWNAKERELASMPQEGLVRIAGRVDSYKGHRQVIIDGAEPMEDSDLSLGDFVPSAERDAGEMWQELCGILDTMDDGPLRRLVDAFRADEGFVERFCRAPAASRMHHAYLGGLLEHTLHVVRLASVVAPLYGDELSRDLLVAGAFFHDIGKVEEIRADVGLTYTDRGNLVGHLVIGSEWVARKAAELAEGGGEPIPQSALDLVQHVIIAHHGSLEFGSPKVPMVPEALVLHYLDNLDAKVHMFEQAKAADSQSPSSFTGFARGLGVRVFKKST